MTVTEQNAQRAEAAIQCSMAHTGPAAHGPALDPNGLQEDRPRLHLERVVTLSPATDAPDWSSAVAYRDLRAELGGRADYDLLNVGTTDGQVVDLFAGTEEGTPWSVCLVRPSWLDAWLDARGEV